MKEDVDLSTIINRNPYLLDDNTLSIQKILVVQMKIVKQIQVKKI